MKRYIFYAVLVLVGGAIAMEAMRHDPGYLLIRFGEYALETTFWFAALVLFAFILTLLFVFSIISKSLTIFGHGVASMSERKERRIEKKTQAGLIHYIEGNWQEARKNLIGVAKSADKPLVHYLAAAQSAYEMGDKEASLRLLGEAKKNAPKDDLTVGISQARMQLNDEKYEQCLATLKRIYDAKKPHPVVLDLLKQVLWEIKDWQALKVLLPELKASKVEHDVHQLEIKINIHLLQEQIDLINANSTNSGSQSRRISGETQTGGEIFADRDLSELKTFWQKLPKKQRLHIPLIELYCKQLTKMYQYKECAELIQRALKREWSETLLMEYASLQGGDFQRYLTIAQEWFQSRPGDAFLLNMLGRLAVKNELWDEAQAYFKESLTIKETSMAYVDYGLLMATLGEHKISTELYEKSFSVNKLKLLN